MTRLPERTVTTAYLVLGAIQLTLGLFIAFAPGAFADTIGGFGTRNDHLARDIATFYLALGVGLAAAAARPTWRRPVLVVAIAQYAFHLVNHIADIADSDPGWVGPFDVGILVFSLGLFGLAWYAETAASEEQLSR
jgi:hypothetical protein